MKTLILVSHPTALESHTQQFFKESLQMDQATWHHLESVYPNGEIDVSYEQKLLLDHDRILFQFPFYWYSSPPLLKKWQDEVLVEGFAYGLTGNALAGKEFGVVVSTGVKEREYQAGGREQFTISEFLRPYQAVALKCQMSYLTPFPIYRFEYMSQVEKKRLLIAYRQYVMKDANPSLVSRENWFKKELRLLGNDPLSEESMRKVELLIGTIETNRDHLDDLLFTLHEMEGER